MLLRLSEQCYVTLRCFRKLIQRTMRNTKTLYLPLKRVSLPRALGRRHFFQTTVKESQSVFTKVARGNCAKPAYSVMFAGGRWFVLGFVLIFILIRLIRA